MYASKTFQCISLASLQGKTQQYVCALGRYRKACDREQSSKSKSLSKSGSTLPYNAELDLATQFNIQNSKFIIQNFLKKRAHLNSQRNAEGRISNFDHHLPPLIIHHLPLTTYYLPLTTYYLPLPTTHHSLFTIYHLPLTM